MADDIQELTTEQTAEVSGGVDLIEEARLYAYRVAKYVVEVLT